MKRTISWLFLLLAASALAWLLLRTSPAPPAAALAAAPVSVTVAEVQLRDLPVTLAAVGRVEAKASVAIRSRIDGQLAQAIYAEGQPVRKGQQLLRIDPAVIETQQRQAEAVLARDTAQLAKAQADFQRNQGLQQQGFISQSAIGQSRADLATAQSNLNADRAALDNARLQLGYTHIVAPMDGVAGALQVPVGSSVKANDTILVVLNQVRPIYVTFSLPEAQLAALKAAQRNGPVGVQAAVAGMDAPAAGELAFIDNAVDAATGAITAKAVFQNTDGRLTPGQFAQVTVQVDALHQVPAVPVQAVESGVDSPYVFVLNPDATVSLRPVKVGQQAAGYQVVASGLAPGERVVTSGQARLRDKSKVAIAAAAAATP